MYSSPGFLGFTMDTVYHGGKNLKYQQFFPEVSFWAPFYSGSNWQWIHKEVECWFGSGSIVFMEDTSHKLDSWPNILELEVNSMLSEAKKKLSHNSWYWVQHSACGGVTTAKVWMVTHHDLPFHKKCPDSLERSLTDIISPFLRSQGYICKTPVVDITW